MSTCTCIIRHPDASTRDPHCSVHGDQAQPLPVPNDLPSAHLLARGVITDREAFGREKYKCPLQPFNGRDPIRDAIEEVADALAYLCAAQYERDHPEQNPDPPSKLRPHQDGDGAMADWVRHAKATLKYITNRGDNLSPAELRRVVEAVPAWPNTSDVAHTYQITVL